MHLQSSWQSCIIAVRLIDSSSTFSLPSSSWLMLPTSATTIKTSDILKSRLYEYKSNGVVKKIPLFVRIKVALSLPKSFLNELNHWRTTCASFLFRNKNKVSETNTCKTANVNFLGPNFSFASWFLYTKDVKTLHIKTERRALFLARVFKKLC